MPIAPLAAEYIHGLFLKDNGFLSAEKEIRAFFSVSSGLCATTDVATTRIAIAATQTVSNSRLQQPKFALLYI